MLTVLLAVSPLAKLTVWRHRGVVGQARRRAVAGREGDSHGASASSRARDRDRGIAAILCHAVGRRAKLQGAGRQVVVCNGQDCRAGTSECRSSRGIG